MRPTKSLGLACLFGSITFAHAEQVPNLFSPNTAASAAEVNENFSFLADRIATLQASSIGYNLREGEKSIEVDCTTDAAALNNAYQENWQYSELNFSITGNCYGDITVMRETDAQGNWTYASRQPTGQNIHIYKAEGATTAGLIPNDLSGSVTIWGGFGGGLYLNDITIQLGSGWDMGAAFSRNSQGSVTNVTITGPDPIEGAGIFVQEGAQVYIYNATISGTDEGIRAQNNATVRLMGTISISNTQTGIFGISSTFRHQGNVDITANNWAIQLATGSSWNGWGQTVTVSNGGVLVEHGSAMVLDFLLASTHAVDIKNSVLEVYNTLDADRVSLYGSRLVVNGGSITQLDSVNSSSINGEGLTLSSLRVGESSSVLLRTSTVNTFEVDNASHAQVNDSTITDWMTVQNNASTQLINTAFTGTALNVYGHGLVNIYGTAKAPLSILSCHAGNVNYENASMLDDAPNSGCMDNQAHAELRQLLINSRTP